MHVTTGLNLEDYKHIKCQGGEHYHTWEYWGCTAGHGAFFGLQGLEQGVIFELPELAKGAFLSFQLNLALALLYFFADFSSRLSRIPSVFLVSQ